MHAVFLKPGEEQYAYALKQPRLFGAWNPIDYDYKAPTGEVLMIVGDSLEECRQRRDKWLNSLQTAEQRNHNK